jgi:hypothetical protein
MNTFKISFEVTQPLDNKNKYLVTCPEMDYESWTSKPEVIIEGLVREWFDLGMGKELPPPDNDTYGSKY